ncbi:D-2-hydroxyacid dehydrogenase [Vibrio sp. SCSIO 43136]|uniref:D-2-hydroxyacid dehydrogenase n=1 Tax=Vibrio sp. SCSIO 43136 TaxID=2819101 RepID=UPI002074D98C|nr:D-2-hydroxyacid dehydrogenase [Vibrio sp. SCSIO 43136]USD64969.1 D-2-hydroxyacid dehydrogenase [Vibrio sp. SCSIO 43136]
MKIVFLDRETIPAHIEIPSPSFEHQWVEYASTPAELVVERIADADIVVSNKVRLDASNLALAKQLQFIAVAATGTNNVDLEACREFGIAVSNVQGYATQSVPEHVLAMMFALKRNLKGYQQDIENGVWQQQNQFCFFTHGIGDIAGSTLGIIGSGALGQAVAALGKALGMQVLFAERKGTVKAREGYCLFDEVLQKADVLTLHCPLSDETEHLISHSELAAMKSSAVLINTGRGGLVDEVALVEALKGQSIAGAGVDVFTQEPAPSNNVLVANSQLPNLLLTPHVAWGSDSAISSLCQILIENINCFEQGRSQNLV